MLGKILTSDLWLVVNKVVEKENTEVILCGHGPVFSRLEMLVEEGNRYILQ